MMPNCVKQQAQRRGVKAVMATKMSIEVKSMTKSNLLPEVLETDGTDSKASTLKEISEGRSECDSETRK